MIIYLILPFLQFFPSYPFLQEHWLGATHLPPFLQPPLQRAEKEIFILNILQFHYQYFV